MNTHCSPRLPMRDHPTQARPNRAGADAYPIGSLRGLAPVLGLAFLFAGSMFFLSACAAKQSAQPETNPIAAQDAGKQDALPPSSPGVNSPSTKAALPAFSLPKVLDARHSIAASEFVKNESGAWMTPRAAAPFPFDELIYSWRARLPEGEGFRLYLQVEFGPNDYSPWIYAGYWGSVNLQPKREEPKFDRGHLAMDQLLLLQKAVAYRFKLESDGPKPLTVLPSLIVIATDNKPSAEAVKKQAADAGKAPAPAPPILDLPLRLQVDSKGNPMPSRCQSAALAAAMEYFGKPIALENITELCVDPEYNYPGIWPRTIGAAIQLGFDAYIDRFRDWDAVRAALAENKVILCSITMPDTGDYLDPPYPKIGGHIVALNGITEDGRVVVTDSALRKENKGFRCQWLRGDFERIWMINKGGVGMVICPPAGAPVKKAGGIAPFPKGRAQKETKVE